MALLPFMLEMTLAIAKATRVGRNPHQLLSAQIPRLNIIAIAAKLDAIGSDILHRSGADRARNQRQIFQTGQPLIQGPADQPMPLLPSGNMQ